MRIKKVIVFGCALLLVLFFVWRGFGGGEERPGGDQGSDLAQSTERRRGNAGAGAEDYAVDVEMTKDQRLRLIYRFDPDEFERAWAVVANIEGDDRGRIFGLSMIVGRMVSLGHPDRALEKIREEFGHGRDRERLVEACFFAVEDLAQFKDHLKLVDDDRDLRAARNSASSVILKNLVRDGISILNDPSLAEVFGNDVSKAVCSACEGYFYSEAKKDLGDDHLRSLLDELIATSFGKRLNGSFYASVGGILPFEAWSRLGDQVELSEHERGKLMRTMIGKNPELALKMFAEQADPRDGMAAGIRSFGELDATAAFDWVEKNGESLSMEARDGARAGLMMLAMGNENFDFARELNLKVSDPELRKALDGQVWSAERELVRKKVLANPQDTISAIVTGESSHADYWLEESITTWLKEDSSAVNEWYEESWKERVGRRSLRKRSSMLQPRLQMKR